MALDDRLQALADFVEQGSRVADVGTDHGYLAIELIKSGKADFVVASDKNSGPLEAAGRSLKLEGLTEKITLRLGDGLQVLKPGEVDTVCLAGMGGALMTEILEAKPEIVKELKELILQPMNGAGELRRWLYRNSWHIVDEALAVDQGHIYEIIKAQRGRKRYPAPVELLIGPVLWEKKPPLLQHHLEQLLFRQKQVASGMEQSPRARQTKKYAKVLELIKELEGRLSQCVRESNASR